jgi:SAM-dependent methyltransferase
VEKNLLADILQWDSGNWFKPLKYWEEKLSGEKRELKCLELGCREGGLSLWLALKGHEVLSSDLENTEEVAKPLHRKYNLSDKIVYKDIDATSIPFENYFDIVVFKSILGGIGRNDNKGIQHLVIQQIYKSLKPGGKLLFAENTRASLLHRFFRKRFTNWGNSWRYVSQSEMKEFLSDFSKVEMKSTGFCGVFGRSESQKKLLSIADRCLFNYIFPSSWKYIVYGITTK